MHSLIQKHLAGENIGRLPVWMMRQAGRFLPSYRAIRKEHGFWESIRNPELAVKISLLPIRELDVDAAILFSDILTLPYSVGIDIELVESVGPVVKAPLRRESDFDLFENYNASSHSPYVTQAIQTLRSSLPSEKSLIGFAGAPWTVATYLVEGKSSKDFRNLKGWMLKSPESLARALARLARATQRYVQSQIRAGAEIIQIFDTWAGEMPDSFFEKHYLHMVNEILQVIEAEGAISIYFPKNAWHLRDYFPQLRCRVLSVDSSISLKKVQAWVPFHLQGNLDPLVLLATPDEVRARTSALVETVRRLNKPAILNLGHGILKDTPVANVVAFLDEAKRAWI